MMRSETIFSLLAAAVFCSLLLVGCAPRVEEPVITEPGPEAQPPKPPVAEAVTLALKFTPQDLTTYRVVTEARRSVEFVGSLAKDSALKGGRTGDKVEMTFTQEVESVDDKGNAVAKITITGLKYSAEVKDNVVLDFDSSREKDQNNRLAKLIGQSYTIEITPAGQVTKVIDVKQAQAAVRGRTTAERRASALVKTDIITQRHTISALPVTDKNELRTGDNWSKIRTFSFGLMGTKSYERVYLLKETQDTDGHRIAVVEMSGIPTAETAEQLHMEEPTNPFSKMFDTIENYSGELKLDLTAGKVEKYIEELRSEWTIVDPTGKPKADKEADALKMTAIRLFSLEKID